MSGRSARPLALVTGGAKRVGRATALALARGGCDVIITYRSSASEAESVIAECVRLGASSHSCTAIELDLADAQSITRLVERVSRSDSRLDVLVHNASSYDRTPLGSITEEDALAAYRANALGPLLLTQGLVPMLRKSVLAGGAAVIGMCDIHAMGEHGLPRSRDYLAYAMSKAALAEMIRTLARELAPQVRVNGVAPGVAAWPESGEESQTAMQEAYLKRVPLGRAGTPDECAEVVRWLALDASYLTGEIIRFDGGRNMV